MARRERSRGSERLAHVPYQSQNNLGGQEVLLDHGYRDLTRIALISLDEKPASREVSETGPKAEISALDGDNDAPEVNVLHQSSRKPNYRKKGAYVDNTRSYQRTSFKGPNSTVGRCFICGSPYNFIAQCPEKHCQKCGQKGHDARTCTGSKSKGMFCLSDKGGEGISVMLPIAMEGNPVGAMLDTGADTSVADRSTLRKLGI